MKYKIRYNTKNRFSRRSLLQIVTNVSFYIIYVIVVAIFSNFLPNKYLSVYSQTPNNGQKGFEGQWQSDFGILDLVQKGTVVEGTYSCCKGKIIGEVQGDELKFQWKDPVYGEGWGVFKNENGEKLIGVWGFKKDNFSQGQWNAARLEKQQYKETPTNWQIVGEAEEYIGEPNSATASWNKTANLTGTALLYFDNDKIAGEINGEYVFLSKNIITPIKVFNYVYGTSNTTNIVINWENPKDGSKGIMYLDRNGDSLKGTWKSNDGFSRGKIHFIRKKETLENKPNSLQQQVNDDKNLSSGDDYFNQGFKFEKESSYSEAIIEFEKAIKPYEKSANQKKLAQTYYNLGMCYLQIGKYETAQESFQKVLRFGKNVDETTKLLTDSGIEIVKTMLGNDEIATPENKQNSPSTIIDLNIEASRLIAVGKNEQAISILKQKLNPKELEKKLAIYSANNWQGEVLKGELLGEVACYSNLARAYLNLKKFDESINNIQTQLKIWQKLESKPNIATSLTFLAIAYQLNNSFDLSENYFLQAIKIQKEIDTPEIWTTYKYVAEFYTKQNRLELAKQYYQEAINKIENIREDLLIEQSKIGFFLEVFRPLDIYYDFVTFLMEHKTEENYYLEALSIAEQARARALLDLIANQSNSQKFTPSANSSRSGIPQTPPWDYKEILKFVSHGDAIYICYFVTTYKTYTWLVYPTGKVKYVEITITREELSKLAKGYLIDLETGLQEPEQPYSVLIAPLIPFLNPYNKIVVLPHEDLNLIPFTTLFKKKNEKNSYFGFNYQITYLPSFTIAQSLRSLTISTQDQALLIGDIGLKNSKDELNGVAMQFKDKSNILAGNVATKKNVLTELGQYEFILFSTHGNPDDDAKNSIYLQLANGDKLTQKVLENFRSQSSTNKIKAKLVVLSGCQTHIGEIFIGDELMSLTRSFLSMGSDYVLATLWKVPDKASSEIIQSFFSALKRGQNPAKALQTAQLEFLAHHSSENELSLQRPQVWGAWVLIGINP